MLGGTGSAGAATVANGGTIEGGYASAGKLTLNGLTFSGTGNINIGTLGNYSASPAVAAGALTDSGTPNSVTFNVLGAIPANGTYQLLSYTGGSIAGGNSAFTLATLPSRAAGNLDFSHAGLIDLNITGTDFLKWTGANSAAWDTVTQNWKLNSNNAATTYIDTPTPDAVVFDDSAGAGKTTVNLNSGDVHPASVTFSNNTLNYLVQGANAIAGPNGVTVNGTGQVTFTNTDTYTGPTTISSGTLQLGDGTTGHDSSLTTSGIADNGALIYNLSGNQTVNYTNGISGSGSLTKSGAGTVTFSGANSYSGVTKINAGTVVMGNAGSLGSGGITLNGGALNLGFGQNFNYNPAITLTADSTLGLTATNGQVNDVGTITGNNHALTINNNGSGNALFLNATRLRREPDQCRGRHSGI